MKLRIIAAVLDTSNLTLYTEDGNTFVLPQGDPRIRRIIEDASKQIAQQGYADVDLAHEHKRNNSFHKFEQQSSAVRFFRIAKEKLKNFFGGAKAEEISTAEPNEISTLVVAGAVPSTTVQQAIDEIMVHAKPISDPLFHEEGLDRQAAIVDASGQTPTDRGVVHDSPDTIIAVKNDKIIPGMERIKSQFEAAAKTGYITGLEHFLERLGRVIAQRQHSVQDLLKFLERADLPIADDGSILIYKVLRRASSAMRETYPLVQYVDCHTSRVPQWVGAKVMMDSKLVDHNRQHECSNGLHVARRGYIKEFDGDVCVLAKLAPEDVIAVPYYDANKMRVCAYHILAELTQEQYDLLKKNQPITLLESGKQLLGKALQSIHHPKITHTVEILAQQGREIKVTCLLPEIMPEPEPKLAEAPQEPQLAEALPDNAAKPEAPVNPLDVIKQVAPQSRKERVAALVGELTASDDPQKHQDLWKQLEEIKKSARVNWERLGVPAVLVAAMTPAEIPAAPANSTSAEVEATSAADPHLINENSYRNRIAKLSSITPISADTAQAILDLKRKSRKSWGHLGVPRKTVDRILKLTQPKSRSSTTSK